jgi:hypothetical protein
MDIDNYDFASLLFGLTFAHSLGSATTGKTTSFLFGLTLAFCLRGFINWPDSASLL